MYRTKIYWRQGSQGGQGLEKVEMVVHIDDHGDYEIHVTHSRGGQIVTDGIEFRGGDGERWLQDRHAGLTGDGFELHSSLGY